MAAQAGLCLAWSETPEDTFCRVVAQPTGSGNDCGGYFKSSTHTTIYSRDRTQDITLVHIVCTTSALIYYYSYTNGVHPMCTSSNLNFGLHCRSSVDSMFQTCGILYTSISIPRIYHKNPHFAFDNTLGVILLNRW